MLKNREDSGGQSRTADLPVAPIFQILVGLSKAERSLQSFFLLNYSTMFRNNRIKFDLNRKRTNQFVALPATLHCCRGGPQPHILITM